MGERFSAGIFTAPAARELLEKAADLPTKIDLDSAKAVGLGNMMAALSDSRLKEGIGVALELTRGLSALKA